MEKLREKITTEKILKPSQPGTKKWLEKYGSDLICVRYRYDCVNKLKIKTIEIIVEQRAYEKKAERIPGNKLILIRIGFNETGLRSLVKSAGGRWDQREKAWKLPYKEVVALGIEEKIIQR